MPNDEYSTAAEHDEKVAKSGGRALQHRGKGDQKRNPSFQLGQIPKFNGKEKTNEIGYEG